MNTTGRRKDQADALKARILEIVQKDPALSRSSIAERLGCGVDIIVKVLKAAGLYQSRARR